ncbi:MAG: toll/interleukin-1 receptor domain-containing protein, partial [Candidatus Sumerlaeota bacterium]|nr:toll/interleukin-1 receptor domain-containing protein [Candidatus Sumerlaeota bacterium]
MEKLAFISYSTEDRDIAERAAALLEARGVGCWIAPDAIPPGTSYAGRIIEGIDSAVATVLILSEAANASVWVAREAERTISKNKTLIPMRIREVQPSRALELFVSSGQSVD